MSGLGPGYFASQLPEDTFSLVFCFSLWCGLAFHIVLMQVRQQNIVSLVQHMFKLFFFYKSLTLVECIYSVWVYPQIKYFWVWSTVSDSCVGFTWWDSAYCQWQSVWINILSLSTENSKVHSKSALLHICHTWIEWYFC